MKAEDLRGKSEDQLKDQLVDLKKQQFNLRFQLSQGQLENTAKIRSVRRDIARVLTLLNEEQDTGKKAPAKKTKKSKSKKAKTANKKKTTSKSSKNTKTKSKAKKSASKKKSETKPDKKDKK